MKYQLLVAEKEIERLKKINADLLEALKAVYNDIEVQNVKGGSDELNLVVQEAIKKATWLRGRR